MYKNVLIHLEIIKMSVFHNFHIYNLFSIYRLLRDIVENLILLTGQTFHH